MREYEFLILIPNAFYPSGEPREWRERYRFKAASNDFRHAVQHAIETIKMDEPLISMGVRDFLVVQSVASLSGKPRYDVEITFS
jgi:hypothetical protein